MTARSNAGDECQSDIHPTAIVSPHAVIEGPVKIGPETIVAPFAHVLGWTEIGARCRIHSHAVVGDVPQDRAFQVAVSHCRIGDETIIREGATVHRGTAAGSQTLVGRRCFLMTNSHVGHNCTLEDDVTLISGSLLGGHATIGRRAIISGNAAVHQFVRVGELAMISGLGKITLDVPPFCLTDRDGNIVGVNTIGMQRAGLTSEERAEIKQVYKLVFRKRTPLADARELLSGSLHTPAAARMLQFLEAPSRRGLARGLRRPSSTETARSGREEASRD